MDVIKFIQLEHASIIVVKNLDVLFLFGFAHLFLQKSWNFSASFWVTQGTRRPRKHAPHVGAESEPPSCSQEDPREACGGGDLVLTAGSCSFQL